MKMAAELGSFKEWTKPSSPRVSYAVAMGVDIVAHACAINCQLGLGRGLVERRSEMKGKKGQVPGLRIHIEYIVAADSNVNEGAGE